VDSSAVSARLIGSIFVEKGLITEEQLEQALELQRTTGERLGEILVEKFDIERLELAGALAEQWAEYERNGANEERQAQLSPTPTPPATLREPRPVDVAGAAGKRPIGEIFVERGLVTAGQLEEALEEQRKSGGRLGEILVATGKLSRLELASALADQWATFQKLRPPEGSLETDTGSPEARIMPTPEAIVPTPAAAGAALELATRIDDLSARVDELAVAASSAPALADDTALAEAAAALAARVDQLESSAAVPRADDRVDELRSRLDGVVSRLETQPAGGDDLRAELAQVADSLRTRVERVEQDIDRTAGADAQIAELRTSLGLLAERIDSLPQPSEWREPLAALGGRIEALPAEIGDWRGVVTEIAERVESLSNRPDDWRTELAELAARLDAVHDENIAAGNDLFDGLRQRIEQVEQDLTGQVQPAAVTELGEQLQALVGRVDALPVPSEEWRGEIAALRDRVESLPVPSEEWRDQVAELHARVESLPVASEEWRGEIAELRSRLESLPVVSEEWREQVAEIRSRFDALPAATEETRNLLSALAARVDGLVTDEWRGAYAELAERLGSRLDRVERERPTGDDELAALRGVVEHLHEQIDARGAQHDSLRAELAAQADALANRIRQLEESPRDAASTGAVALEALVSERSEELRAITAHLSERIDHAFGRLDELSSIAEHVGAGEVEERLAGRLGAVEAALAETQAARAMSESLAERIGAVEERASAISMHSAQEIELLRRRLGELQSTQTGIDAAVAAKIEDVAGTLRAELTAVTARVAHDADLQALSVAVSERGAESDAFGQKLLRLERRLDETGAARGAELAAMRTRLENVETRLTGEVAGSEAISEAKERVDRLERLLHDATGLESDARRDEIEKLRSELGDRVAAVESAQANRKQLRDVVHGLERVERRIDARESVDEAATRAIEKTVRKGLAKLGEQITDAEGSYLEASRKLHAAIEGLGRAVDAADEHLGGDAASRPTGATYVAFAPTLEGYRLVVCSGPAPVLGERVVVPACEGELVVSRVGTSPLPFDARACVYLEQA
jgi:chromosome segregation ATPase